MQVKVVCGKLELVRKTILLLALCLTAATTSCTKKEDSCDFYRKMLMDSCDSALKIRDIDMQYLMERIESSRGSLQEVTRKISPGNVLNDVYNMQASEHRRTIFNATQCYQMLEVVKVQIGVIKSVAQNRVVFKKELKELKLLSEKTDIHPQCSSFDNVESGADELIKGAVQFCRRSAA